MRFRRVFLSLACLSALVARAGDQDVARYNLYSKGLRVGTVRTERSRMETNGVEAVKCDVTTKVHVNLLILRHDLEAREVYVSSGSGPIAYSHTKVDGGRTTEVTGVRSGDRFRFVISETGVTRTNEFADADYDAVSMDGPELALADVGDEKTLRLLDMGEAQVVARTYRRLKDEAGFLVVEFNDANKRGRRWVKADDLGMFIGRQDGKDKAGTYSMRITP
jgi:hypothetical protein